jgi:hypothetical protein
VVERSRQDQVHSGRARRTNREKASMADHAYTAQENSIAINGLVARIAKIQNSPVRADGIGMERERQ